MKISKDQLENRSLLSNALMWNQQLWGRSSNGTVFEPADIPPAIEVQEDGSVLCRFFAPEAETVSVGFILGEQVPLTKDDKGIWSGTLSFDFPGLKVIVWKVNGVEVMNPYAPIGYGYGRPMNYVDIPCPEQDYLMIKDVPHGSVVRDWYRSETTGEWESCLVYLPPKYFEETEKRYPVLYLQHGGSQNENGWVYEAKTNFIMDNLLAEGKAEECIIVMNNGMVQIKQEDGSWQVDVNKLEDLLIKDCVPFIDGKYRTKADAWNRAYAGLSQGSLQGAVIFTDHQDVFASAGLFTGFPMKQYPEGPRLKFELPNKAVFNDPETFNKKSRLFYLTVGADEPSVKIVRDTSKMLSDMGIKNEYMDFPGGHEWHVWRACLHDFLQKLFR